MLARLRGWSKGPMVGRERIRKEVSWPSVSIPHEGSIPPSPPISASRSRAPRHRLEVCPLRLIRHVVAEHIPIRLDGPVPARLEVDLRPPVLVLGQALVPDSDPVAQD